MKLDIFDFSFPKKLIADYPIERGMANMLVISKKKGYSKYNHKKTSDLIEYLNPGDGLVINNTRVIPARLWGTLETGRQVEILLVKKTGDPLLSQWEVIATPNKKIKEGSTVHFSSSFSGIISVSEIKGTKIIRFNCNPRDFASVLNVHGKVPLPPYIKRAPTEKDKTDYQTDFADIPGAIAAPTAGLHLSNRQLDVIQEKGVSIIKVTLHVGPGTFLPVRTVEVEKHKMHSEWYHLSQEACDLISGVKKSGGRLIAVGTTSARVLETVAETGLIPGSGWTEKFIYPGYKWKLVDGLMTNFHWPKSTLLIMISSILGVDNTLNAYKEAIDKGYRLFSYGDSMLIY